MEKEEELSLISNQLLLNGTLTKCPSLLHGKMGISIFFFHYAHTVFITIEQPKLIRNIRV